MKLNKKFIIGLAQSDPKYGLDKNNKVEGFINELKDYNFNSFDTAEKYLNSEKILSEIPSKNKKKVITKISFDNKTKDFKNYIKKTVEKILINNRINQIYGLLIHDPITPLNNKRWRIIYDELRNLKKKGYIKKIGISVYNKNELDLILNIFKPEIIQFPLNVFNQSFDDKKYLQKLKRMGIELHARSIFLQGILLKDYNQYPNFVKWESNFKSWKKFLKKNNLSSLSACLRYVLNVKYIDYVVIGLSNKKQFISFKNELIKINKSKKKYTFDKLNSNETLLNDPRYWRKKNDISEKYQKKWINVKKNILNGTLLLSKRPEQFVQGAWPSFYNKAQGCFIWDNLNNKYLDFSLMGIGTNILGYADNKVNSFVKKIIDNGSISTLNSNLDYELSKILLKLHPWSKKVTFARTGGEANAVAIRIARAFTKKDEIAICGYHGWHDWYLSSNLSNSKNLDRILLEGLSTIGIPKKLEGMIHPFRYNDIKSFKRLLSKNKNIGIVFMEVERNEKPKRNFLKEIRKVTKEKNIVLIFDECTSGFREVYGGLHKKYNVNPDIATFGKSLGNGIPITAIIGREELMENAKKSFISSTFWTDSTGPAAAISTLKEMKRLKSWEKITKMGRKIKKFWKYLSKKYDLDLIIFGIDAMPAFKFNDILNNYYRTYMTQEFLKKNILATNSVYCSVKHEKYLNRYFNELDKIFSKISKIKKEKNIIRELEYPVSLPGFRRLN